jgi:hypothetical protein
VLAKVTDAHANPLPEQTLRLSTSTGTLSDTVATSDDLGRVRLKWTPPTKPAPKGAARVIRATVVDTKVAGQIKLP